MTRAQRVETFRFILAVVGGILGGSTIYQHWHVGALWFEILLAILAVGLLTDLAWPYYITGAITLCFIGILVEPKVPPMPSPVKESSQIAAVQRPPLSETLSATPSPRFRLIRYAFGEDEGHNLPFTNIMARYSLDGADAISPIEAGYFFRLVNLQSSPARIESLKFSAQQWDKKTWLTPIEIPQKLVKLYFVDRVPWAARPFSPLEDFREKALRAPIAGNDEVTGMVLFECPDEPALVHLPTTDKHLWLGCIVARPLSLHIKELNGMESTVMAEDPTEKILVGLPPVPDPRDQKFVDLSNIRIVRPFPAEHAIWALPPAGTRGTPAAFDKNAPLTLPTPKPSRKNNRYEM